MPAVLASYCYALATINYPRKYQKKSANLKKSTFNVVITQLTISFECRRYWEEVPFVNDKDSELLGELYNCISICVRNSGFALSRGDNRNPVSEYLEGIHLH